MPLAFTQEDFLVYTADRNVHVGLFVTAVTVGTGSDNLKEKNLLAHLIFKDYW